MYFIGYKTSGLSLFRIIQKNSIFRTFEYVWLCVLSRDDLSDCVGNVLTRFLGVSELKEHRLHHVIKSTIDNDNVATNSAMLAIWKLISNTFLRCCSRSHFQWSLDTACYVIYLFPNEIDNWFCHLNYTFCPSLKNNRYSSEWVVSSILRFKFQ